MTEPTDDPHASTEPLDAEVDPAIVAAEAKRQRTFRRWFMGIALCIVGVVGTRLVWGFVADWRLNAEIEQVRASGQPLLFDDFAPLDPVKNSENAAIAYQQAYASIVRQTGAKISYSSFELHWQDVSTACPEEAEIILKANEKTLALIHEARTKPKVDWGYRFTTPATYMVLPHLSSQRAVSRLVLASAIHHHNSGRDADAIESILDALAIGDTIQQPNAPTLINLLVSMGTYPIVYYSLEDMLPTLVITEPEDKTAKASKGASRKQAESLMRILLDDSRVQQAWREATQGERAYILDSTQSIMNGTLNWGWLGLQRQTHVSLMRVPLRPVLMDDTVRLLRDCHRILESGLASNYSDALKIAPPSFTDRSKPSWFGEFVFAVSRGSTGTWSRTLILHFNALAQRRMAATAIAIRLFEIDHGARPESLAELVPTYLEALPEDPFASDGRSFGYLPHDAFPRLYSVGENGTDENGRFELWAGLVSTYTLDMPFFLNGDRPGPEWVMEYDAQSSTYEIVEKKH